MIAVIQNAGVGAFLLGCWLVLVRIGNHSSVDKLELQHMRCQSPIPAAQRLTRFIPWGIHQYKRQKKAMYIDYYISK